MGDRRPTSEEDSGGEDKVYLPMFPSDLNEMSVTTNQLTESTSFINKKTTSSILTTIN